MTLERENSISIEYDAAFVQNVYLKSFTPEPHYDVADWADRYRLLSGKSAAEPGEWKTSRTPYLKEVMNQLSTSSPAQRIVFMKGAQVKRGHGFPATVYGATSCSKNHEIFHTKPFGE